MLTDLELFTESKVVYEQFTCALGSCLTFKKFPVERFNYVIRDASTYLNNQNIINNQSSQNEETKEKTKNPKGPKRDDLDYILVRNGKSIMLNDLTEKNQGIFTDVMKKQQDEKSPAYLFKMKMKTEGISTFGTKRFSESNVGTKTPNIKELDYCNNDKITKINPQSFKPSLKIQVKNFKDSFNENILLPYNDSTKHDYEYVKINGIKKEQDGKLINPNSISSNLVNGLIEINTRFENVENSKVQELVDQI